MDKVAEGPQGGKQTGGPGASSRSGKSGEGARSALEHLLQQEKNRTAQLPRDGGDADAAQRDGRKA